MALSENGKAPSHRPKGEAVSGADCSGDGLGQHTLWNMGIDIGGNMVKYGENMGRIWWNMGKNIVKLLWNYIWMVKMKGKYREIWA